MSLQSCPNDEHCQNLRWSLDDECGGKTLKTHSAANCYDTQQNVSILFDGNILSVSLVHNSGM